jgi:signal transduction histidine kinase
MAPVRRGPRSRLLRIADVAVPLVVALFLASLAEDSPGDPTWLAIAGILVGLGTGAALWWRRSHPVTVFAIALAGGLVIWLIAPEAVFPYAALIAIGSLAAARPLRVSLPALAALLGLTALNFITSPVGDAAFAMPFPVVAWALGEAARNRRAAIEEAARRAVGDEQARIARELHDVIAHSVSVIVVQAAAADDVFDERPDQARAALRSIESAGRDALGELRRLLGAVQPGHDPAGPQPGLDRLGELIEPLRAAGLEVELRREGADAGALPAGVELSAYRIVQEALTNTLRHAGATRAQ